MTISSTIQAQALINTLSAGRIGTYEAAVTTATGSANQPLALDLYAWNATVAGAFMIPLHIYEVALRNAISSAIEQVYGHRWPWQSQFTRSLSPKGRYSPQKDLEICSKSHITTGKVIPELKFAFWEHMLKNSHTGRIWDPHFRHAFPHSPASFSVADCVKTLRDNTYEIRSLRNRIAHHEPIFHHDLTKNLTQMTTAIEWICPATQAWLSTKEQVTDLLAEKPI
jgi:hypothetical protein